MISVFRRQHAFRFFVAGLALVLAAGACSGSETDATEGINDVEAADDETSADQAGGEDEAGEAVETDDQAEGTDPGDEQAEGETLAPEEAARQFSQCMRDEGLDFPDLEVDSTGNINTGELLRSLNLSDPAVQTALTACQDLLGSGGLTDQLQETLASQELADALIEFSECVRLEGFDVPDLTVSGILGGALASGQIGGADSTGPDVNAILATTLGLDPEDPAVQAAMVTCFPAVAGVMADLGL